MYPMVSNLGTHILNIQCSNSMSFVAYPKLQLVEVFGGIMKSLQMRWGVVWMWGYPWVRKIITQFKYVVMYRAIISLTFHHHQNDPIMNFCILKPKSHQHSLPERQQHPTKCDFQFIYLMKFVMKQIAILTK